jgi:hypothetical protein
MTLDGGVFLCEPAPMRWWNSRVSAKQLEPEPPEPIDRVAAAHAEMAAAKAVLDELNRELKGFYTTYGIRLNKFDQIAHCIVPPGRTRQELDALNAALQKRKGRALHEFGLMQKVWSDAIEEAR